MPNLYPCDFMVAEHLSSHESCKGFHESALWVPGTVMILTSQSGHPQELEFRNLGMVPFRHSSHGGG